MKINNNRLIRAIAVAAVFTGITFDGLSQVDIKKGLVAHYPLDGDAKEAANGSLHGTYKGNPKATSDRNGKNNSALSFDGKDDWIHIPLDPKWKIQKNDFSVSLWVKTKDHYAYLFDARDAGENGFAMHFHFEAPGFGFGLGGSGIESGFRTGNNSDIDGQWHHFVGVRDGRKLTIFKDGVRVKSFTTPVLQDIKNVGSAKIGTRSRVLRSGEYLKGSLDEIRLYNRALSSKEVEFLYAGEIDSDKDGLSDAEEIKIGSNPNKTDSDGDGLNDYDEVVKHGTNPTKSDSDGDQLNDDEEILVYKTNPTARDSDDDGLSDYAEIKNHKTNPLKSDTDEDGLGDRAELLTIGSDPKNADTDNDGLGDYDEVIKYGSDPTKIDSDGDTLSDFDEVLVHETDPMSKDSDDDGFDDDYELTLKTNPNDGDETPEGRINVYTAVELEFHASKGKRYQVQHSTDLVNWEDFGDTVSGQGGIVRQLVSVREMDAVYWRLEYK